MEPTDTISKPQINMARSTVMTNTQEQDTNTVTRQMPEELSEQDTQAVNGGGKVGNPLNMLNDVLRHPRTPSLSPSSSSSSSMSSLGLDRMHEGYPTPGEKKRWSQADKAEAAAIATGSATSFAVGLTATAIQNKL